MIKTLFYTYLGTNGTVSTPIFLEGIYSTKKYQLIAEPGKLLTQNGKETYHSIFVPVDEVDKWYEIDD